MKNQTTFLMIKPGAVQKNLIGTIITRIEQKGLTINALKMIKVSDEQATAHYYEHVDKPFFGDLLESLQSSPVICIVISGNEAVAIIRKMAGATKPLEADIGTIRGDFSCDLQNNIVHTSDSVEAASREIKIYFEENEIISYTKSLDQWSFSL